MSFFTASHETSSQLCIQLTTGLHFNFTDSACSTSFFSGFLLNKNNNNNNVNLRKKQNFLQHTAALRNKPVWQFNLQEKKKISIWNNKRLTNKNNTKNSSEKKK